ncbi:CDGSH iron-sulfur domain-containing protein [Desertibacillus haloalkaliphilus]|uniref:CDGSH iron-sulfur domain-containing protein n=1 Tax=Desertibacillus haloalkaliphilus TaxID=1328930 RepID=UPI001C276E3D|nr:CDGSH iron-sulfur domain-containing protein [Desertibacillus haloalkaliphilus]MBU8906179.1 CDGSH iron-sulfur domain-containing protein [Desertibacillus haloalkaliphilus]
MATIKVNDDGSLRVTGDVELVDGKGNTIETKQTFSLCRCGLSNNKPFCDGSHKGKFESSVRA